MEDSLLVKVDTVYIGVYDSSMIVSGKQQQQIIVIQDKKIESSKAWFENPWIVSFLIPILVSAFVAWLTNLLNKKKNKVEIDKLKAETLNLKNSFQPIVIGTLQSIQDKIIHVKIEALKSIIQIRNDFTYHEQQYCEGDPITPDYDDYLNILFYKFSHLNYDSYKKFHEQYSYLFPDNVFKILNDLYGKIKDMYQTKNSFDSIGDPELEATKRERAEIDEIIKAYNAAILAIRTDCHLDTSFIHDFIEKNK